MTAPHTPDIQPLLRQAEIEAERIVSLARMIVALGLFAFFALVIPPAEELQDAVLIRQGALALVTIVAYFLAGLLTWAVIQLRLFHRWMLIPATLIDVLFVLGGVWISMQNTGLTGDAMFVFPSIWLVILIFGFSVLRGNPKVLAAQVILVCGGLVLVAGFETGKLSAEADSPIWLFLALPPNLMRITLILASGLLMVLAVQRTRRFLRNSIRDSVRSANLTRYLPGQMAPRLAAGALDDLRRGQKEKVAVLFIDICGFTNLSEKMSPQEVSDLVTEFRHIVSGVVEAHDGMIDKFMGDAAMVLFSNPDQPAQAAVNGIACARALHSAMMDWSDRRHAQYQTHVYAGIGLHYGTVFSGVVGDETRLEYTVFGDAVNVAARLQEMTRQLALPVLASREAVAAAGAPDWVQVANTALRGRSGDTDILQPAGLDTQQWL